MSQAPVAAVQNKPCMVRVVVREDTNPDIIIHDKTSDHNDRYFRDWIMKTMWWALRNGKNVTLYPVG